MASDGLSLGNAHGVVVLQGFANNGNLKSGPGLLAVIITDGHLVQQCPVLPASVG